MVAKRDTAHFTFHYVSINTIVPQTLMDIVLDFTFHYVSINTWKKADGTDLKYTLHSTMFLLIQKRLRKLQLELRPLHSTMFLLILAVSFK